MKISKPWGAETLWAKTPHYAAKLIHIKEGCRLSLQYHRKKTESIYVLQGRAEIYSNGKSRIMGPGKTLTIPPQVRHRFSAPHGPVTIVEVSTPELDDVVRIADDYGREDPLTWEDR